MSARSAEGAPCIDSGRFEEWNRRFAELLVFMDGACDAAGAATIDALRCLAPDSVGYIWVYRPGRVPVVVYADAAESTPVQLVREYQLGTYSVDPVFRAARAGFTGCATLCDLMPEDFERSDYWSRHYVSTDVIDQLVHFVTTADGCSVQIALIRNADFGRFSELEVANQQAVFPALAAAVREFDPFSPPDEDSDSAISIESSLSRFGADLLSAREREVVLLLLQGHSAESTGHQLGLSPETIRLYRRNAYAKLGLRSQGELFHRFLEFLR